MYSKMIARDLRLVKSQLYRMAMTRPQVTCSHYIYVDNTSQEESLLPVT
jgi:hypothetical protein